jgi:hypothetical protein
VQVVESVHVAQFSSQGGGECSQLIPVCPLTHVQVHCPPAMSEEGEEEEEEEAEAEDGGEEKETV